MRVKYECEDCGAEYAATAVEPRCPKCGSENVRENWLLHTECEDDDLFFLYGAGFFDDLL